jgi:hypothetical protein
VFSEEEAFVLDFTDNRMRICSEDGLLVESAVNITVVTTDPFVIDAPGVGAVLGDQIIFLGFPSEYNMEGRQATITAISGDEYTLAFTWPSGLAVPGGIQVSRVYAIDSPYGAAQLNSLRSVQSLDVVYLTNLQNRPYKLNRRDTYKWDFEPIEFNDGPYQPTLIEDTRVTWSATGRATPKMTDNTTPSGSVTASTAGGGGSGAEAFRAFDQTEEFGWIATTTQKAWVQYTFDVDTAVDGFSITLQERNGDISYTTKDFAPLAFTFYGIDVGGDLTVLHKEKEYVAYEGKKSLFFELKNKTAYRSYRLDITELDRNGDLKPSVGELILRGVENRNVTLTFDKTDGINAGDGLKSTDVGRLIRIKDPDGSWRSLKITSVTNTTECVAYIEGEPFSAIGDSTDNFKLGYWSDTTGWPNAVAFYQDRAWWGGSTKAPDLVVGSVVGDYENMQTSTPKGEVLDTSAISIRLNSRKLSRVKWIEESDKGLLVGTGSEEYVIKAANGSTKNISAENVSAVRATRRGSAGINPAVVDDTVLYVQRSARTLREYAFNFEADNFRSPSMNLLANHIGAVPFKKLEYAAEPHSIIWCLREDGSLVGLTYNREENVVGWHQHDISGAVIESIAVIPARDQLQDILFMSVKRVVNGEDRRYIEKLTRFWDFGMDLDVAHFVDSGLRYTGEATTEFYGLTHLEGEEVYGLADGIPVGPLTVTGGMITLEHEAENIVLGLGFESYGETQRLDVGSSKGTALGKEKRIHSWDLIVWRSYGGDLGTWNEDTKEVSWSPIEYVERFDELTKITLFDDEKRGESPANQHNKRGTIFWRRRKDQPLPLNIVALMPNMDTQDDR